MKKKILFLLLLLLFPTIVFAKDTCNDNNIKIKSITLKELNGFSEEIQEPNINNNTINLNLKMYDVGDSSIYDITIENTSNEDYYFTKDSMKLENDYLEYSLKNDSETIPANSEKTIELRVTYKNKIPNENYSDTSKLMISLSDQPLENPKTKITYTFIFIIISLIIITIYKKINNKSISKKKLLLVLTSLSIIPLTTTALCTVNLNIETKIEIESKEAIFLPGQEVNMKMKELAGDDTSTSSSPEKFQDNNIFEIKYSNIKPINTNKEEKNIVSNPESQYPIYMWYDNGTIYWWSEDTHPSLNEDASGMFYNLLSLENISGLENFMTSNTKNMQSLFAYTGIFNTNELTKWNTSKVENLRGAFVRNTKLKSINGLKNWDVSKVTDMSFLFNCCYNLEEIDLSNWKTDALTNMNNAFGMWDTNNMPYYNSKLKIIKLSEKFDTSKVVNMYALFANNGQIEDYSFLQYIDIQNVENLAQMFQHNSKLKDIKILKNWDSSKLKTINGFIQYTNVESLEGLENWNVSNVTDMRFAFRNCQIKNLTPIQNWDVSNVNNFAYMFPDNPNLTDASAINNWTISSIANYSYMFTNTPSHPEFTKVQGTWDVNGTFTPTQ